MWVHLFSSLIAASLATAFIGGLAYSIWERTGGWPFPIIAITVLLLLYKSIYDEIRQGPDNT